jgi:hypothetical protein
MSEAITSIDAAPITLIGEWQGPAVNHPALAGDDTTLEGFLADPATLPSVAIWVAVSIASAVLGPVPSNPVNPKVIPFLDAWRRRHGQAKLDELERQVLEQLKRGKAPTDILPEEVCRRTSALFDRIAAS